jgi:hypothetical protein
VRLRMPSGHWPTRSATGVDEGEELTVGDNGSGIVVAHFGDAPAEATQRGSIDQGHTRGGGDGGDREARAVGGVAAHGTATTAARGSATTGSAADVAGAKGMRRAATAMARGRRVPSVVKPRVALLARRPQAARQLARTQGRGPARGGDGGGALRVRAAGADAAREADVRADQGSFGRSLVRGWRRGSKAGQWRWWWWRARGTYHRRRGGSGSQYQGKSKRLARSLARGRRRGSRADQGRRGRWRAEGARRRRWGGARSRHQGRSKRLVSSRSRRCRQNDNGDAPKVSAVGAEAVREAAIRAVKATRQLTQSQMMTGTKGPLQSATAVAYWWRVPSARPGKQIPRQITAARRLTRSRMATRFKGILATAMAVAC